MSAPVMVRLRPNVLVTGTPGTGKTSLCQMLIDRLGAEMVHLDVGEIVRENEFYDGYDEQRHCHILDEDRLLDELEDQLSSTGGGSSGSCSSTGAGFVVDYHSCELFPQRWFDLVVVLRANNTVLFDRLSARGGAAYSAAKVRENVECEIFGVVAEEALESYEPSIVHQLENDSLEQLEQNVDWICGKIEEFKQKASSNSNCIG